jgi:Peptidase_C39 like family
MKKLLLTLLLISNLAYTQDRVIRTLDVPKFGQDLRTWCTSASLQMILKSYRPNFSVTQKRLFDTYFYIKYRYKNVVKIDTNCLSFCDTKYNANCERQIPTVNCNNYSIENKNVVLKWFGLSSDYIDRFSTQKISFDLCKQQIDNGHPFIVFIDAKESYKKDTIPSHSVVVFGYIKLKDYQILLVNDPWRPCDGCQYGINFETIKNEFKGMIFNIKRTKKWKNIKANILEKTITCQNELNKIIDTLRKYPAKELYVTLNNEKEYATVNFQNYYKNIDTSNLSEVYKMVIPQSNIKTSFTFREKNQNEILFQNHSPSIQNTGASPTITQSDTTSMKLTREPNNVFYVLKTFDYCTCSFLCCQEESDPCKLVKNVTLKNQNEPNGIRNISIGTKENPYTLLIDPINNVSFQKFKVDNKFYVTPIQNVIINNKFIKKNNSYPIDKLNGVQNCPPFCFIND